MKKRTFEVDFANIFLKLAGILILVSVMVTIGCCYMYHQYNVNIGQHIENAENATTPENAILELDKAIEYAQEHNMTSGITVARRADNDLAIWFKNLEGQRENYEKLLSMDSERQFTEMAALKEVKVDSPAYISTYTVPILTYVGWFWVSIIAVFAMACVADEFSWCWEFEIPQRNKPKADPA